jgi:hypothetical protein
MQDAQNTKRVTEFQEFTDSAAVNAAYTASASV